MASDSLQIPVSLQVNAGELQSVINDLQASMNKVKPDSKAYARLSNELIKIQSQMDAITADMRQGFQNPGQVGAFEKKIRNLSTALQTTAANLGRVKFDDLNLNLVPKDELDRLKQLQTALTEAQDKVNNFQTSQMRELVDDSKALKDTFSELKLDLNTTSYDKAVKAADNKLKDLQQRASNTTLKLQEKQKNAKRAEGLALTANSLENIFKKGERDDKRFFNSKGGFRAGGKAELLQQLQELGIDKATLKELGDSTVNDLDKFWERIDAALQKKDIERIVNTKAKQAQAEVKAATAEDVDARAAVADMQQLVDTFQRLANLDPNTSEFAEQLKAVHDAALRAAQAVENQKRHVEELAGAQKDAAHASNTVVAAEKSILTGTRGITLEMRDAATAAREMEASQQRLTSAIKQWFSLREVINLTKRAITDAVAHIKELDATMTQIAVVTDMSQSDLWGQISTYSAIAQQYGVSTNGVYQVSQLFYQQGKLSI